MTDPNTRRLLDKIDMLERQVGTQSQIIDSYRRKNARLTRKNEDLAALVPQGIIPATQRANFKRGT